MIHKFCISINSDLSGNRLNGTLPESLGSLEDLQFLCVHACNASILHKLHVNHSTKDAGEQQFVWDTTNVNLKPEKLGSHVRGTLDAARFGDTI